jgi:hypothetical protein
MPHPHDPFIVIRDALYGAAGSLGEKAAGTEPGL